MNTEVTIIQLICHAHLLVWAQLLKNTFLINGWLSDRMYVTSELKIQWKWQHSSPTSHIIPAPAFLPCYPFLAVLCIFFFFPSLWGELRHWVPSIVILFHGPERNIPCDVTDQSQLLYEYTKVKTLAIFFDLPQI